MAWYTVSTQGGGSGRSSGGSGGSSRPNGGDGGDGLAGGGDGGSDHEGSSRADGSSTNGGIKGNPPTIFAGDRLKSDNFIRKFKIYWLANS